jgi:DNA repair protein RecN (Recombination protein N)
MNGARFTVDLKYRANSGGIALPDGQCVGFDENGLDQVEFLIAPNPGEGLKPLVKIASGGETSRLMLALKNVLVRADHVPTLIFDEIDQGIGGRVGSVVGEKLWQLGREHQVLCVTHLPQLAAFGDQHYRVRKLVQSGRTLTQVDPLAGSVRLDELAQMLGTVSAANLSAAKETLDRAQKRAEQLAERS